MHSPQATCLLIQKCACALWIHILTRKMYVVCEMEQRSLKKLTRIAVSLCKHLDGEARQHLRGVKAVIAEVVLHTFEQTVWNGALLSTLLL